MLLEGQVAPVVLADGTNSPVRQGKSGEVVVTELHGKYFEQTFRGNTYIASTPLAGVAAGAASAANTMSATGTWALQNPNGSGVDLVIIRILMQMLAVSTLEGSHWLGYNSTTTPAQLGTGTLTPAVAGLIGAPGRGAVARAYFGATLPVLPAVPTALMPLWMQGTGAITAYTGMPPMSYDPDGGLIVPQGVILSGQGVPIAGAALANLVAWAVEWEEVPYPALS